MTSEEKAPYHTIMVDAWRIFTKERIHEKYSDAWWEELIGEYTELRNKHKQLKLDDYICQLSQVFLDEYERGQGDAKPKRVSQAVLPNPQGYDQEELQLSDPICEVGGLEEIVEPFT